MKGIIKSALLACSLTLIQSPLMATTIDGHSACSWISHEYARHLSEHATESQTENFLVRMAIDYPGIFPKLLSPQYSSENDSIIEWGAGLNANDQWKELSCTELKSPKGFVRVNLEAVDPQTGKSIIGPSLIVNTTLGPS
jgi:hypothetical protein